MGTCTSTARHRQKQERASHSSSPPPLPPLPLPVFPIHQRPYSIPNELETIFHPADRNSLIQLYSTPNKYQSLQLENTPTMSSSNSSLRPPSASGRIPVPKTRLPVYHPPADTSSSSALSKPLTTINIRPKSVATGSTHPPKQIAPPRPMSSTARPPTTTTMTTTAPQSRFGFISRGAATGAQASTFASRSRSISPNSTVSAHSSSSSSLKSQRVVPQTTPTQTKIPRPRDSSVSKLTPKGTATTPNNPSHNRSRTPSRTSANSSASSSSSSAVPSPVSPGHLNLSIKTDVNAVRDRYKSQKRMNFFTRRVPIPTANGSPMMPSPTKSPPTVSIPKEKQTPPSSASTALKAERDVQLQTPSKPSTSTVPPTSTLNETSAHLSQGNRHRQRAISMLSSASAISDVLNQDALLEDDNCSLKSDDLMCDYEETLTMDSTSKTERTDSLSSMSLSSDVQRKMIESKTAPTRDQRSTTIGKASTNTTNGNVRESLDELTRLSQRIEPHPDHEPLRKPMTRSVSLKPPSSYLPPLEDAEQITMDIESYRQVMKDVMVVKTILHQLDRLLKHSDGANMTDSMIGSFYETYDPMITSRRYSTSNDSNVRCTIDENTSYEDLVKEIVLLRKEKEQDRQTIKLLQEQMYKYSSHATNGSS